MRKPDFITFTGADDQTDINDLIALARDYPGRVEFAILYSPKRTGTARYPTGNWRRDIQSTGLQLAAHLCGEASRQLIATGVTVYDLADFDGISRIQVNTSDPQVSPARIRAWADGLSRAYLHDIQPILQCRGSFPDDNRVSWLFDQSGGAGIEPDHWPIPCPDTAGPVGYAGGIGPQNVTQIIARLPQSTSWWIDMESKIRVNDQFDIGLCRQVCEAVYGRPAVRAAE